MSSFKQNDPITLLSITHLPSIVAPFAKQATKRDISLRTSLPNGLRAWPRMTFAAVESLMSSTFART